MMPLAILTVGALCTTRIKKASKNEVIYIVIIKFRRSTDRSA